MLIMFFFVYLFRVPLSKLKLSFCLSLYVSERWRRWCWCGRWPGRGPPSCYVIFKAYVNVTFLLVSDSLILDHLTCLRVAFAEFIHLFIYQCIKKIQTWESKRHCSLSVLTSGLDLCHTDQQWLYNQAAASDHSVLSFIGWAPWAVIITPVTIVFTAWVYEQACVLKHHTRVFVAHVPKLTLSPTPTKSMLCLKPNMTCRWRPPVFNRVTHSSTAPGAVCLRVRAPTSALCCVIQTVCRHDISDLYFCF